MVLLLILLWLVFLVVLWGVSLWLQSYLYSEPASGMHVRAPVAASVLTLFFASWFLLESSSFNPAEGSPAFDAFFYSGASRRTVFREFAGVRIDPAGKEGKPARFRSVDYAEIGQPRRKWSPTDEVIVQEDGHEVRFRAEKDAQGNFLRHRKKPPAFLGWLISPGAEEPLRYTDDRGRVMTEDSMGLISTFYWSRFRADLLLNVAHLVVWFGCFWLIMRFEWPHALGIALVLWGVMTLAFIHMLVTSVDRVRAESAAQAVAAVSVRERA